jgi:hypothetical protein
LRRHAIETGIIERLYDVDWGVTRALIAEGLSAEVAAREGGIDEGVLETASVLVLICRRRDRVAGGSCRQIVVGSVGHAPDGLARVCGFGV